MTEGDKMKQVYARNCRILEVSTKQAEEFINKHHLQGSCEGQRVCVGLELDGELLALMTFGYPRYNKNVAWEILRLCYLTGVTVVGGASKLLNYFIESRKPDNIISYCNLDYFTGKVYEKLKFKSIDGPTETFRWRKGDKWLSDSQVRKYGVDKLIGTHFGKGTNNEKILISEGWTIEHYQTIQTFLWDTKIDGIIYKITNKLTGNFYIGQSKYNDDSRWRAHIPEPHSRLDRAIQKYGKDNFEYEVIDRAGSFYELSRKERKYIAELKPYYNDRDGGRYNYIVTQPEEVKKKISDTMKLRRAENPEKFMISEETKQRLRECNLGKKQSEETKQKHSNSMKGRKPHEFTEETRKKMSESAKRYRQEHPYTEKEKRVIAEASSTAKRGKVYDISKAQMAAAEVNRGRKHSPEEIVKRTVALRAAFAKKKLTPEESKRRSDSMRGRIAVYDERGKVHYVMPDKLESALNLGWTTSKKNC